MPHQGVDPLLTGAHIVTALQSIVSRNVAPLEAAVVSVTQVHGGDAWNVIPESCVIRGTCRSFDLRVQDSIEPAIRRIAEGVCQSFGAGMSLRYERRYPPTINAAVETEFAAGVAGQVVGADHVDPDYTPTMGSEDFAFMLQAKPGCYIFLGNGTAGKGGVLHNARYDFNDEILPIGASYWARLVETALPRPA
jgi:hippurate hydrolase